MYDKELRPFYFPMKILSYLFTKKWGISLVNRGMQSAKGKNIEGLYCEERYIPSKNNGPDIRVRIFRPLNADKDLPGLLYNHGGGYFVDVPEGAFDRIEQYIATRPCVVVAPDYRKSTENPFPAGFNDCYDTLLWMKENASSIGINPSKLIVAGHSAGGGLTAAITLKARDTKEVNIAFQMPIYPMIDHLQNSESAKNMERTPVWSKESTAVAWDLYLKNVKGEVPAYAAPTLNTDYKNFPPTITFVGDLEPFKDETINYVEALKKENIPVQFEIFKGAFHAFEIIGKDTMIGKRANDFQFRAFGEYYDRYL